MILRDHNNHYKFALIGVVTGFSFLFRDQIAFAVFGLFLWFICIKRERANIKNISFFNWFFVHIMFRFLN
jgi:4-amino-4-deoxy-L-arabinose transferase-like glycosyltransferase